MADHINLTESQKRVLWFVRIRWAAIFLLTLMVLFLKYVSRFDVEILPSLIIIGAAAAYNFAYPYLVRSYTFFSENATFTFFRVNVDFLVLTALVYFTGGIESHLYLLYLLELLTIAMFGFTLMGYFLSVEATVLYLTVCFLEAFSILPHHSMGTLPGSLYLNIDYILARGFALLFTCVLFVYTASYLVARIAEKQKEIEKLNKAKAEFMNDVMHETKSPLTAIIGYADLLIKGTFGKIAPEQADPLNIVHRQSKRMLNLINDILNIARIESGVLKIAKEPRSIADVIEHSLEGIRPQIDQKGLILIQEIDPKETLVAMDEARTGEVIVNLLSNAIKFSRPGGTIFVSSQILEKKVQVAVRDEGMGIDPADLPHIFDKFYRASKESAAAKGTGLGLALSKAIVEAHGGRIWAVSSGPGLGSIFYFTLPL